MSQPKPVNKSPARDYPGVQPLKKDKAPGVREIARMALPIYQDNEYVCVQLIV
jgi:hypothetical protein